MNVLGHYQEHEILGKDDYVQYILVMMDTLCLG